MASSQYTPKLHLNAWTASDRPKRADFVADNTVIDTQIGGHIADGTIHVTAEEKAKLAAPYTAAVYAGNGESSRTITLDFRPTMAIVYKRGVPPVVYKDGVNVVNAAVSYYGNGATPGLSINSSGVVVTEAASASNGSRASLNESGAQYTVIAFK